MITRAGPPPRSVLCRPAYSVSARPSAAAAATGKIPKFAEKLDWLLQGRLPALGDQVRCLRDGSAGGVDAQVAEACALQRFGFCG